MFDELQFVVSDGETRGGMVSLARISQRLGNSGVTISDKLKFVVPNPHLPCGALPNLHTASNAGGTFTHHATMHCVQQMLALVSWPDFTRRDFHA